MILTWRLSLYFNVLCLLINLLAGRPQYANLTYWLFAVAGNITAICISLMALKTAKAKEAERRGKDA